MQRRLLLALALLVAPGAHPLSAQDPAAPGRIAGQVYDSLAGAPLRDALVQVDSRALGVSRSIATDSVGTFTVAGLPSGRYTIGFLHPLLDSLGIEPPLRQVDVSGGTPTRVDLGIPSAPRLRAAMCGSQAAGDSNALVLGTVRDPRDGMPIGQASVTARWMEVSFSRGGISQRAAGTTATTGENGWFALCGLPAGTVELTARRGTDSTLVIELQLGSQELRRRDLHIAVPGQGRLGGRVVAVDSARPIVGARVSVAGGPETTTDANGDWTLRDVPLGTRMLDVRGIGFYPARRAVDVVAEAPPVEVALETFQAVLEAVRVTAARVSGEAALSGFAERQRGSGMGRFYDAAQIARRNPIYTSDLLRTMPGFVGDGSLTMKGNFSDGFGNFDVGCTAEVYVDGHLMRGITSAELDGLVAPEHIVGIEVYNAGSPKPPQFDSGMSGCGALVIWQKPANERIRRR